MMLLKRLAQGVSIAVPLLMLGGCFPTETDNGGTNNPLDPADPDVPIIVNDDPTNLPTDINPSANTSDAGIDSMFNLLVARAEAFENVGSPADLYALDFTSLRQGVGAAVNKTPAHEKANVGFIVSSVLSFNSNADLKKVIDSMDAYINDMDAYYATEEQIDPFLAKKAAAKKAAPRTAGFLSKTFTGHGVISAGQALFAETPKILMAQTSRPSFPRFLTVSYIQNMIETGVIPRLNEVVAATQRLRALNQMSLRITVDGETAEIDVGDVMLLEGMVRAARAGFTMMCVYNYDIYSTNGSNDMRWIDSYIDAIDNLEYEQILTYSLSGDTLCRSYYYDMTGSMSPMMDAYRYNINRPEFLGIRRNYHAAVLSDLKEVPVLIKAGLTAIKNESDNQDDDLIPSADIFEMSSEMGEVSQEMLEEGFSPAFASKFQSPEALMDFISSILSNPYTFDETIDGRHIRITVDLSKFFTNPAASLKEYWPKYRIPTGNDRFVTYTSSSDAYETESKTLYIYSYDYDSVRVDIPAEFIDSIGSSVSNTGTQIYYLKYYYQYSKSLTTTRTDVAIQLIDDQGNPINYYDLITKMDNSEITSRTLSTLLPYYNDYTFKGIFPDMKTRQNWVDFFSVFTE